MKKVIAVEEGLLENIKSALEKEGYRVAKPGSPEKIDAVVLTGLDINVMGMQDIQDKSAVIDSRGKTPEQILNELKARL